MCLRTGSNGKLMIHHFVHNNGFVLQVSTSCSKKTLQHVVSTKCKRPCSVNREFQGQNRTSISSEYKTTTFLPILCSCRYFSSYSKQSLLLPKTIAHHIAEITSGSYHYHAQIRSVISQPIPLLPILIHKVPLFILGLSLRDFPTKMHISSVNAKCIYYHILFKSSILTNKSYISLLIISFITVSLSF